MEIQSLEDRQNRELPMVDIGNFTPLIDYYKNSFSLSQECEP